MADGKICGGVDKIIPSSKIHSSGIMINGKIIYEDINFAITCKEPIIKIYAVNQEEYKFITGAHDEIINIKPYNVKNTKQNLKNTKKLP